MYRRREVRIPRLMVTREHGSWAVVFVPLVVGIGVAGRFDTSELLLVCVVASGFMMYVPLQTILRHRLARQPSDGRQRAARFWVSVFGAIGFVSSLVLVLAGFPLVLLFALLAAIFFGGNFLLVRYFQKTLTSDLIAVAGLTLGAPAAYYTASARIDEMAVSLWILNVLFFGSGIFYVHMKMHASGLKKQPMSLSDKFLVGRMNIFYHLILVIIVVGLSAVHLTPQLAILAFVPVIAHTMLGTARLSSRVRYKSLGFALLAQSLLFCALVIFIARH